MFQAGHPCPLMEQQYVQCSGVGATGAAVVGAAVIGAAVAGAGVVGVIGAGVVGTIGAAVTGAAVIGAGVVGVTGAGVTGADVSPEMVISAHSQYCCGELPMSGMGKAHTVLMLPYGSQPGGHG